MVLAFALASLAGGLYGASAARYLSAGGLEVPGSESQRAAESLTTRLRLGAPDVIAVLERSDGDVRDSAFAARPDGPECGLGWLRAGVVELVDTRDLGSRAARRGGSSPSARTRKWK